MSKAKSDTIFRKSDIILVGFPTRKRGKSAMQVINNYIAHTDSKKRITFRKSKFKYYDVKEYDNGCLVLEPRELVKPKGISDKALQIMDDSVANFKKGKVSASVDLSDF